MPTLRERSERFLSTLSSQAPQRAMKPVDLCKAFHKTAHIHDLNIEISGVGQALINEQSLNSICDNLFGNYIDESRRNPTSQPSIEIKIEDSEQNLAVSIRDINGRPCVWPERLFEPFWSEKGDGLGIGLYHARQLVTRAGGSLQAITPKDEPMTFVVYLPKSL
ncbi:MAG: ATP-binding protein [Proteobacteria bacterium]|nr:ATP-binding protein [Pseudomonadota bacterium]